VATPSLAAVQAESKVNVLSRYHRIGHLFRELEQELHAAYSETRTYWPDRSGHNEAASASTEAA